MQELPIDAYLPGITASLGKQPNLVLVAEPGAGKTTRLPAALLDAPFTRGGQVLVLEPRRLAARMAARRIASELGEEVGERVGYAVRFERKVSARTRVVFLTEALLTRRLLDDPALQGVSCVVLDEFHERSLHTDLGLALLRALQLRARPELRIVVMSATLDAERVSAYLDAPIVNVPGRTFPVAVTHLDKPDDRRLEEQVAGAVRRLCVNKLDGDVLVFLPGAAEIRRCEQSCAPLVEAFGVELATLHGDLPPGQQDRAVSPGKPGRPKIVLSTNIAETSLTLEGVVAVVDSGLARIAGHSPWSGLSTLSTGKISQASAVQRAGRAGRVRAGQCVRLYTKPDFDTRARFDTPELAKSDLCSVELTLRSLFDGAPTLAWFEPPPEAASAHAIELLERLGALEGARLSSLGRAMLGLPVHPRLARVGLALCERGFVAEAALLVALLSERDVRLGQRAFSSSRKHDQVGESDLLARLDAIESVHSTNADTLRRHDLDPGAVQAVFRTRDQLARAFASIPRTIDEPFDRAVLVSTLLGFPDRVGKRRTANGADIVLSGGGSAALAPSSVVKEAELVVAVEAEERGRGAQVHAASAVEADWLLEYFPDRVRSERTVSFAGERIEVSEALMYDALVLDASKGKATPSPDVAQALAKAALARAAAAPWDVDAVEDIRRRVSFAIGHGLKGEPLDVEAALIEHCADKVSFDDLRADPFEHALARMLDMQRVNELAPSRVRLAQGRELKVHYELDRPPWIESRLQDFFGLLDGPRIGGEPLVLHLLAPNQRPVQVSTDLRGFWDRHYASVRKELMRRYPRHSWPEDPRTAKPPEPRPPRRS
ncbi:MAG: ATP-dependent helicase HrpB [Polyangiales bacterium]